MERQIIKNMSLHKHKYYYLNNITINNNFKNISNINGLYIFEEYFETKLAHFWQTLLTKSTPQHAKENFRPTGAPKTLGISQRERR